MMLGVIDLRSSGVRDLAPIDPRFTFKSFALLLNAEAVEQGAEIFVGAEEDRELAGEGLLKCLGEGGVSELVRQCATVD